MGIVSSIVGILIVVSTSLAAAFRPAFRTWLRNTAVALGNGIVNILADLAGTALGALTWPFTQWRVGVIIAVVWGDIISTVIGCYFHWRVMVALPAIATSIMIAILMVYYEVVLGVLGSLVNLLVELANGTANAALRIISLVGLIKEEAPRKWITMDTPEIRARVRTFFFYLLMTRLYLGVMLTLAPYMESLGGALVIVPAIALLVLMAAAWAFDIEVGKHVAMKSIASVVPAVAMAVSFMILAPEAWDQLGSSQGTVGRQMATCIRHIGTCVREVHTDRPRPPIVVAQYRQAEQFATADCEAAFQDLNTRRSGNQITQEEYETEHAELVQRCELSIDSYATVGPVRTTADRIEAGVIPYGLLGYAAVFLLFQFVIFATSIKKKGEAKESGGVGAVVAVVLVLAAVGTFAYFAATRTSPTPVATATAVTVAAPVAAPAPSAPVQHAGVGTGAANVRLTYVRAHSAECPETARDPGRYGDPRLACRAETVQVRLQRLAAQ